MDWQLQVLVQPRSPCPQLARAWGISCRLHKLCCKIEGKHPSWNLSPFANPPVEQGQCHFSRRILLAGSRGHRHMSSMWPCYPLPCLQSTLQKIWTHHWLGWSSPDGLSWASWGALLQLACHLWTGEHSRGEQVRGECLVRGSVWRHPDSSQGVQPTLPPRTGSRIPDVCICGIMKGHVIHIWTIYWIRILNKKWVDNILQYTQ